MGLLSAVTDLNEADISVGHRRVYTPDSLLMLLQGNNLNVLMLEGNFLKFLSNKQTESFTDDMVEAFYQLGKDYPDLCSEIVAVAEVRHD